MSTGSNDRPYAPRRIVPLIPEHVRGWMVKRYGISADRDMPPPVVIDAGRVAVECSLPEAYPTSPSYAVSLAHEDADGCYFVIGWWSPNRLILSTRTWASGWDDPKSMTEAPDWMTACVWELAVIAHENDAWLRHVLRPRTPDLDGYLAATLDGSC